jgi:nucleoside-diphosphate-sugar epimerase
VSLPELNFDSALVTGGAGFIGSHLAEALADGGCRVTVLDNLASGNEANLRTAADRVRFIRGDIRDREAVEAAAQGVEVVFHLAAVVSVPKTVADPIGSTEVNELGSLNVLEAARRLKARRLVFASSSAVYGDEPTLPKREAMPPRPLTPYAVQKLSVEYHLKVYGSLYGLETASLRFFNVFGPRQDPSSPYSGVISVFMTRALNAEPPVIYGDGRQSRDFIYVADVVQALIAAASSPAAPGGVFNVGTGSAVTVLRLWESIASLAGIRMIPSHGPARVGDVPHSVAAVDSARDRLGFLPQVSLEDGLRRTLDWYRESTRQAV